MAESDHIDSELSGESSEDSKKPQVNDESGGADAASADSAKPADAADAKAAAAKIRPVKPSRKRQRNVPAAAEKSRSEAAGASSKAADDGFEPADIDPEAEDAAASLATSPNYRDRRRAAPTKPQAPVRPRGRSRSVLLALVAVLASVALVAMIVGSVLFATATNRLNSKEDSQQQYVDFAKQIVVNLTTLNPQNVDQLGKQVFDNLSGGALNQMQTNLPGFISAVQKYSYSSKGTIIASAVARDDNNEPIADANSATVLIVSGYQATSPQDPNDSLLNSFRWKLVVTKINGQLKVTDMQWVT